MDPTLENDGWRLENGVERHARAPDTFEIPPEAIRARLVPESLAKLIFTLRTSHGDAVVERMWVQVTGYTDDGYEGVLESDPQTAGVVLGPGDRVNFRPEHVIDAEPPESWNSVTRRYETR